MKCLIAEDEPFAQAGLKEFVENISFLQLESVADDALDALEVLQNKKIDLMFLDIQMPKLNGLDLLKTLIKPPLIILTTAFPEYALKGYEYDVIDYLVKPIPFERFVKAVNKAKAQFEQLNSSMNNGFFFIKTNKKLEKINISELLYVEALSHYVALHTNTRKYITYLSLKKIEEKLPAQFIKIHKSYLVSFDKIESIDAENVTVNSKQIPVSKIYKENLAHFLKSRVLKG